MALITSSSSSSSAILLFKSFFPHFTPRPSLHFHTRSNLQFQFPPTRTNRPIRSSTSQQSYPDARKHGIVVVGAGIAGLATAVSFHRLGIGSLVLEQAESLRTGGTSLTLFKNGWRVLDAIGVADELRPQFLEIQGFAD